MTEAVDPDSETVEIEESRVQEAAVHLMIAMQDSKENPHKMVKKVVAESSEFGKRVFSSVVDGWTPFHAAVLRGSKKILKTMLGTGFDVNQRMGQPIGLPGMCTALHIAAHRGDLKIVEYLLSRGALINLKDSSERPPLYYAAASSHLQVVKVLLRYGAEVEQSGVDLRDKNNRKLRLLVREFSLVEGRTEQV